MNVIIYLMNNIYFRRKTYSGGKHNMKLILLGVKKDQDYKLLDPKKKEYTSVDIGESLKGTVSPFPFEHFSSLSKIEEGWEHCYLEVEANLTENEFNSMKSSGLIYYRFYDKEIKVLNEFKSPFKYSLDILKKFGDNLGTYNLTTWVIHSGIAKPEDANYEEEFESMKEIIDIDLKINNKADYSLSDSMIEFLPHLLDNSSKYLVTFGQYGRVTITQEVFDKINFTKSQLIQALKLINNKEYPLDFMSGIRFNSINHPMIDYDFYLNYIKNSDFKEQFFENLTEVDLQILNEKGFPVENLFIHHFKTIRDNLTSSFEYDDLFVSLEQYYNSNEYQPEIHYDDPYQYYCCPDCEGWDIYEMYPDGVPEPEEYEIDLRVEMLLGQIDKWVPYLTSKSRDLFNFIPESMYDEFTDSRYLNFYNLLKFK